VVLVVLVVEELVDFPEMYIQQMVVMLHITVVVEVVVHLHIIHLQPVEMGTMELL